ncbi:TIGR02281 family clan AA aspartic protease [Salinisphaera sp. G21_0]|uniref:retropepsin-like aspartic protease family protein n=1 Tax=Salinisphaera sp. G21_0 TaxID=2821094 RepID=UPI001ADC2156|nr:TIGR02281 family clan AA aspartic protease [Salinisphaera sp. G21_0]MBO9481921.1 TIGR02281 family clan AA aspartic protease [Salinisphaera sp. G21_0]
MRLSTFLLALAISTHSHASNINVVGLFSNKALVIIDGQRHLLATDGKSVAGIKLLKATSTSATLEVNGKAMTYRISRDMNGGIQQPEKAMIKISRNNRGQYITRGRINDRAIDVLVDTGANVLAINSLDAKRLGIDYQAGTPIKVATASDLVDGYQVNLSSVLLGNIRVNHVEATVIEGSHPDIVLLGMSFLKHVKLSEHRGVMQIEANY